MKSPGMLTLVALSIALPVSAAGHCAEFRTSTPTVEFDGIYVVNDLCQPGCILSLWIYAESNGIPGLQRDDMRVDDTCHGLVPPDTLLL